MLKVWPIYKIKFAPKNYHINMYRFLSSNYYEKKGMEFSDRLNIHISSTHIKHQL